MISNTRVVTAPRTHRALSRRERGRAVAAPQRASRRHAIFAGVLAVTGLVIVILTHAGTYNAALTRTSEQANSLIGSSVVQQGTRENQLIPRSARPVAAQTVSTLAHSQDLARIYQLNPAQYNSQQDYDTWAYSACSTAAMTYVINTYGHHYRIADVLKVEAGLHEITPDQGLLEPAGIDRTVAQFGFKTYWLQNPTLTSLLAAANSGVDIIIGFPPETFSGGHVLVVRGSTTKNGIEYVHLADSSRLNMEYMDETTFATYWRGFAVAVYPKGKSLPSAITNAPKAATNSASGTAAYSVLGKPTLSADFINRVLASYNSPAEGRGQALYDLGVKYGIDPAFALAFFMHESSFGTQGEAQQSLSLGNLRCIDNATCQDGYAWFNSWEDGFQAWYELIRNLYVAQWGLTTVDTIIPTYAPASDNNDEAAYIASVKHSLDVWHSGQLRP